MDEDNVYHDPSQPEGASPPSSSSSCTSSPVLMRELVDQILVHNLEGGHRQHHEEHLLADPTWVVCRFVSRRWNSLVVAFRRSLLRMRPKHDIGPDIDDPDRPRLLLSSAQRRRLLPKLHAVRSPRTLRPPIHFTGQVAAHGWLSVLRWAATQGCPGTVSLVTARGAARGGHLAILDWLQCHGMQAKPTTYDKDHDDDDDDDDEEVRVYWDESVCREAARGGHVHVLDWLTTRCPWDKATCSAAARSGKLDVVQWLYEHGCPWGKRTSAEAARGGHLEMLKWLVAQSCPLNQDKAARVAALHGHLEILCWLKDNNLFNRPKTWDKPYVRAIEGGHFEVLKWLHAHSACHWGTSLSCMIAWHGKLEMLQWASDQGCPLDGKTCRYAAAGGHLAVLQWARDNGCPWDENPISRDQKILRWGGAVDSFNWTCNLPKRDYKSVATCEAAAQNGHLDVLQWAHANGCPCDEIGVQVYAAAYGHLAVIEWAHARGHRWDVAISVCAARGGHLDILQWAHAKGLPLDESHKCANSISDSASAGGHVDVLQWLNDNGVPWGQNLWRTAAIGGHTDVLRWALANGHSISEDRFPNSTFHLACRFGHLDLLQWLHANVGQVWDNDQICNYAALQGDLKVIKWARAQACPWSEETCKQAARGGHLSLLKWLRANGCPWDPAATYEAASSWTDVRKWIDAHKGGHDQTVDLDV